MSKKLNGQLVINFITVSVNNIYTLYVIHFLVSKKSTNKLLNTSDYNRCAGRIILHSVGIFVEPTEETKRGKMGYHNPVVESF